MRGQEKKMKRKNLMNDKVIKAMTLGLATMIAITSTPVSAFADEGDDATSNEDAATEYSDIEGVSDDAQDALNDASSSIESAVEYAEVSNGQELNVEDATIGNVIAGVYTPPAGVEAAGEYDPSKENVVNAGEVKEKTDAVINEMESIGENISDISSELIAAENLDIIEEKNAKDSVEAVNAAVEVAEDVEEYMEKASAEADELADSINNAENEQSARESFNKLQKLTEDAAEELEKANEILSDMEDKYSEAKKKLLDAESLYKKAVKGASDNEGKLEEKINNLQEEVDALESALKTAQDSAESTYKAALKILEAGVTTKDYRKLDSLFSAIMKGYYIPQSVADATDVEVSDWSWKEYDYDYNYCKVTYKVNGEEVTKYYNYIYKDEAGSKGIQIFEKSADEVGAAEYITSKYKNENDAKKAAESGIYAYTEDGETKYITGTEKEAVKSIKSDNNLITQNKQYSDNNMHIQATDEGLSAFLESDSDGAKAIKAAQEKVNQNNTWRLDDKLFEALMVN